jgi:hypothetical protein
MGWPLGQTPLANLSVVLCDALAVMHADEATAGRTASIGGIATLAAARD